MDQLPPLGTELPTVIPPTRKIYAPLLRSNADAIQATPCRSFSYGKHPRHQLDIYTPPSNDHNASSPIIIYLYGGGYFNGDKTLVDHQGLVYANVGHFFAKRGFTTVVPDYRLISHGAAYPSGAQDLYEVVEWTKDNLGASKRRDLYMIGNSAGGGHLGAFLLDSSFLDARKSITEPTSKALSLKSAVFLGAPVYCDPMGPAVQYLGSDFQQKTTIGLLKRLSQADKTLKNVNIIVSVAELDPDELVIKEASRFVKEWRARQVGPIHEQSIPFHNHISPPLALGTNIEREEAWAVELLGLWQSFKQTS